MVNFALRLAKTQAAVILSHGVIGNTSDFGSEESRFDPWWDNFQNPSRNGGVFLFPAGAKKSPGSFSGAPSVETSFVAKSCRVTIYYLLFTIY